MAESQQDENRVFWLAVREGLLVIVRAIERRYLPALKASKEARSNLAAPALTSPILVNNSIVESIGDHALSSRH